MQILLSEKESKQWFGEVLAIEKTIEKTASPDGVVKVSIQGLKRNTKYKIKVYEDK